MKQLCTEKEAELTELKRELLRRVSRSKFFDGDCHYTAPKAKMPVQIKRMIREIDELEKELENNHDEERKRCKNSMLRR